MRLGILQLDWDIDFERQKAPVTNNGSKTSGRQVVK